MAKTRALARLALELDGELPAAHVAFAIAQIMGDWDWAGAERSLLRALELNPSDAWAHLVYAWELTYIGRLNEAIAHYQRIRELDPLNTGSGMDSNLGYVAELLGDLDGAQREWDRILELDPDNRIAHRFMGIGYCQRGDYARGIELLQRAGKLAPGDPVVQADLAYCYAIAGHRDAAIAIVEVLERYSEQTYISPMTIALIRTGLGEYEVALDWLERAYEVRAVRTPSIGIDARFAPLHAEPRFRDLLIRMGLPTDASAEEVDA